MALFCLILGLTLGPGYFIYAKFYSGRLEAELPLTQAGTGFAPTSVTLPTGRGTLRLILKMEAEHGPTAGSIPRNIYSVRTTRGSASESREISLASVTTESTQQTFMHEVARLDGLDGQPIAVEILARGEPDLHVRSATLELRSGVAEPSRAILGLGGLLIATGIGLMML